ncbi:hypothetical protein NC651_019135 [Populus alba x Populus x berolinensis]|nr:hypothetical protein NC651_019135 [Populus alba x Populus x berolinensis]
MESADLWKDYQLSSTSVQDRLKERERELRKQKEREEQEMERVRVKVRRNEAIASFQALLVETIKDPQMVRPPSIPPVTPGERRGSSVIRLHIILQSFRSSALRHVFLDSTVIRPFKVASRILVLAFSYKRYFPGRGGRMACLKMVWTFTASLRWLCLDKWKEEILYFYEEEIKRRA